MTHQAYKVAEDARVTRETAEAIAALTKAELLRLRDFARYRLRVVGSAGRCVSDTDLLHEAIAMTLRGQRRWKPENVSLYNHLVGVMRSVSSHLAEEFERMEREVDGDALVENDDKKDDDEPSSLRENVPSSAPSAERIVIAKQHVEAIEAFFSEDPIVLRVISAYRFGQTFREVEACYGIPMKDCEAAGRRLRRSLGRIEKERNTDV